MIPDRRLFREYGWRRPQPRPFYSGLSEDISTGRLVRDYMRREMLAVVGRDLWPWRFPDPNPFPEFILFPRLARLERKAKR